MNDIVVLVDSESTYPEVKPEIFRDLLEVEKQRIADAILVMSSSIFSRKKEKVALVSVSDSGATIGILVKRCIKLMYGVDAPHYLINYVHGEGLDEEAMKFICQLHRSKTLQFVDGWTGNGSIVRGLEDQCEILRKYPLWADLDSKLAVLCDPTDFEVLSGTTKDFTLPSVLVRGDMELTHEFIECITEILNVKARGCQSVTHFRGVSTTSGMIELMGVTNQLGLSNLDRICPGCTETVSQLLLGKVKKVLVNEVVDKSRLEYISRLCDENGVEIVQYPFINYSTCSIL